ncbi:hypothetical protein JG688_00004440 [Phytophthora aleatoria]|uniref:Uncharacterized protein n=1 Tax=Phytophthora aleatoria TaxID=2496075 RepID=A0A8J5MH81_9STRA|nr:hypothetical protein JG688_00004440 [Phytophthora aleatoria]
MPRSTPVFTNNMIAHRGLRSARPLQTHRVTNKPKYDWSIFADTFVKLGTIQWFKADTFVRHRFHFRRIHFEQTGKH